MRFASLDIYAPQYYGNKSLKDCTKFFKFKKGDMMKKVILWALIIILSISMISVFGLTGCTEETPVEEKDSEDIAEETTEEVDEEEEVVEEAEEEVTEEPDTEELGVKPPEEEVTLNIMNWAWFDDPEEIERLTAEFYEKYPTIKFELTRPPFADQDTLLSTGFLSGEGPDIWGNNAGGGAAGLVKYVDYALPLDSLCAQEWGEDWKNNFSEAALSTVYWGTDGTNTIALPEYVQVYGSSGWYNKSMFDDLSIEQPKTMDELYEVSEVLKENGIGPIAHSGGEGWTNYQLWFSIAGDYAGDLVFDAVNGEASFTDEKLVAATERYKELFENELFGTDPFTGVMYFDWINAFFEEKYGMSFMGNWEFRVAVGGDVWGEQDPNTVFSTWHLPDWNEDGNSPKSVVYPAILWSINKDISEEKQRAAFIFLKEMVSGIFAEARASKPAWMAFKGVEPDFEAMGVDEQFVTEYELWNEELQNAIGVGLMKYTELEEAMVNNLNEVAAGIKTPQEAMEAVQSISESIERTY